MPKSAPLLSPQAELLTALRRQLIPWTQDGSLLTALGVLPIQAAPQIEVCPQKEPLLKMDKMPRSADALMKSFARAQWKERGLLTLRHLSFVFVLEGQADLQIGVTTQMAKNDARLNPRHGRFILRLPQRGFLAVPPDTPFTDGLSGHFEKRETALEKAHCDLLWLGFLPEGLMLHICRTRGASHVASPKHFVMDFHGANIGELIVHLLRNPDTPREIALLHLQAILKSVEHALAEGGSTLDASGQRIPHSQASDRAIQTKTQTPNAIVIERACDYIATHLTQPLTAAQIADYAYASPSHLNRLFRAHLNSSVMQYVTQRRLLAAHSLLTNTNLPVSAIGRHMGYRHPAHFSLAFKRQFGMAPALFRRQKNSAVAFSKTPKNG
jgi:AraC-like DNA-binding protein